MGLCPGPLSDVTVSDTQVRISGPSAALLHQTAMFADKGELVPSFAQEWRPGAGQKQYWTPARVSPLKDYAQETACSVSSQACGPNEAPRVRLRFVDGQLSSSTLSRIS